MYVKVNKSLNFFKKYTIPIPFKKMVLQFFIISKALYYAPLLGSNKNRTAKVQLLLRKGMLWCIGFYANDKKKNLRMLLKTPILVFMLYLVISASKLL